MLTTTVVVVIDAPPNVQCVLKSRPSFAAICRMVHWWSSACLEAHSVCQASFTTSHGILRRRIALLVPSQSWPFISYGHCHCTCIIDRGKTNLENFGSSGCQLLCNSVSRTNASIAQGLENASTAYNMNRGEYTTLADHN
jgi:hypothetical protein